MATGKYTSLEEARKQKKLDRFIKEHPSEGNKNAFDGLLDKMIKSSPKDDQTSEKD